MAGKRYKGRHTLSGPAAALTSRGPTGQHLGEEFTAAHPDVVIVSLMVFIQAGATARELGTLPGSARCSRS